MKLLYKIVAIKHDYQGGAARVEKYISIDSYEGIARYLSKLENHELINVELLGNVEDFK